MSEYPFLSLLLSYSKRQWPKSFFCLWDWRKFLCSCCSAEPDVAGLLCSTEYNPGVLSTWFCLQTGAAGVFVLRPEPWEAETLVAKPFQKMSLKMLKYLMNLELPRIFWGQGSRAAVSLQLNLASEQLMKGRLHTYSSCFMGKNCALSYGGFWLLSSLCGLLIQGQRLCILTFSIGESNWLKTCCSELFLSITHFSLHLFLP